MKSKREFSRRLNKDDRFLFFLSGGVQYLMDVALFSVLILFIDSQSFANLLSRIVVGTSGFVINGVFVFGTLKRASKVDVAISFFKYLLLIFFMAALSNSILSLYNGSSYSIIVICKIFTEIVLAILSFFIQKILVYKNVRKL